MTEQGAGSDVGATATRAVRERAETALASMATSGFARTPTPISRWSWHGPDGAPEGIRGVAGFGLLVVRGLTARAEPLSHRPPEGQARHARWRAARSGLEGRRGAGGGLTDQGFKQMADMVNQSRPSNGVRASRHHATRGHGGVVRGEESRRVRPAVSSTFRAGAGAAGQDDGRGRAGTQRGISVATALEGADAGEGEAYRLCGVLTPLVKAARPSRRARRVTGDAMEVRGGCGYVEEWSEARLARECAPRFDLGGHQQHRRLDVAARCREDALPASDARAGAGTFASAHDDRARNHACRGARACMCVFARDAWPGNLGGEVLARQAASSALYHVASARVSGKREGRARIGSSRRLLLAQLVPGTGCWHGCR